VTKGVLAVRVSLIPIALFLACPTLAAAQVDGDHHDDASAEIVVTGILARSQNDILAGTSVLSDEELTRDLRPTIGETLTRQAGVSATSFGPNASRPVLRGFQGERVRVLSDGIGSFDVSNTSVDHAVIINPLTADRIEVLRGPSALLFGSSAIGGVVNVIDSRIPRRMPDEALHIDAIATYGSAAKERSLGGRADIRIAPQIVAHLDATYAKTSDLRTGGLILTPALRAEAASSGDPEIAALATLKGKLPNSAARTWEVAGGLAWIGDTANFGASVARYDSLYGIPVRYATVAPAPGEEGPEAVRLDVKQTRYDLRGEWNPDGGFIEAVRMRGGYADYRHNELEEDGAIGTSFFNKGGEGRLEVVQREKNGWEGAIGAQFYGRNFSVVGEEKFLPPARTRQYGLFTVQSFDKGIFRAEVGGRIERTRQSAKADVDLGNPDIRRSFTAYSGSAGGSLEVLRGWRIGLNAAYTERAPSAEELFPNGPHAGTQAFEIGDPRFNKERSKGLELTLRGKGDGYSYAASVYRNWFNNFIYELPTGASEDGLPVFQFLQDKAVYSGIEFDASFRLLQQGGLTISVDGVGDFTTAKIKRTGGNLFAPRIPSARLLGGIEAKAERFTLRTEVEWVDGQDRVSPFETRTKGYTLTNASLSFSPFGKERDVSLLLSANNIFDVVARRHASFLKDYAALAGRDVRVTLRASF
jgi:iron complex outermembrane recepter protein